ncbi:HAD-IIB family hydrolase [Roseimaritima ulvae]|uniref:Mannosylfructose-phosphate phosphatase n=1 Tax=Roseimaritima ulvae TaxID=980254 RepID=A0A5B9R0T1_9BACT|nr:HAD-IIB family hydrolase [Roseimaritima ulvae]QEG43850.1 Mannosylfructose-phosphate phosphatase [Roseimaritima ulvae]
MNSPHTAPLVLATDLDGTLIPLDDNPQHRRDLSVLQTELQQRKASLVFVTGRHFESVQQAITQYQLPLPQWIICDVGTSLFARQPNDDFAPVTAYAQHLQQRIEGTTVERLQQHLAAIDGMRLQESEKQGPFKLSYYADAAGLDGIVEQIEARLQTTAAPYRVIASVDPFNNDGLIDLLPRGVSKAHALEFWSQQQDLDRQAILFAGDSGNDVAALTAGYRSIVVGNAADTVVQQVRQTHQSQGWTDRLYVAKAMATSGVLEGLRHYAPRTSAFPG